MGKVTHGRFGPYLEDCSTPTPTPNPQPPSTSFSRPAHALSGNAKTCRFARCSCLPSPVSEFFQEGTSWVWVKNRYRQWLGNWKLETRTKTCGGGFNFDPYPAVNVFGALVLWGRFFPDDFFDLALYRVLSDKKVE